MRLIGIDTPERGQPGYKEAKEFLRALVEGKRVRLEREDGHKNRDGFGRLLRLVWLDDPPAGMPVPLLLNAAIIEAGHSEYESRWGRSPTIEAALGR